jgi:hypothetical protein
MFHITDKIVITRVALLVYEWCSIIGIFKEMRFR